MIKRTIVFSTLLAFTLALFLPGQVMAAGRFLVSDYESEGNDDPFQDAINAAEAAGGGFVVAEAKTYNEALVVDDDNVWIIGAGIDQTIVNGGTDGHAILIGGATGDTSGILVRGLTAKTTGGQSNNYDGISIRNASDVMVVEVEVEDADRHAFSISNTSTDILIAYCVATLADEIAFFSGGTSSTDIQMIRNVSDFNSSTHTQLWISSDDGLFVQNDLGRGQNNSIRMVGDNNTVCDNTNPAGTNDTGSGNCVQCNSN